MSSQSGREQGTEEVCRLTGDLDFRATGAAPRSVCLVDDVYTSGATASAAAQALRKAGATRVEVVCFARAVR